MFTLLGGTGSFSELGLSAPSVITKSLTLDLFSYWIDRFSGSHTRGFFIVCSVLLLSPLFLSLFRNGIKNSAPYKTDVPLQALLTVLTPSCSIWPSSYLALVRRARTSKSQTIKLPLFKLLKDVTYGQIELRDPQNDLPDLLRDHCRVYAWFVCLEVEISCQIAVLRWLLLSDLPTLKACNQLLITFCETYSSIACIIHFR
jgi:hypothetical protein